MSWQENFGQSESHSRIELKIDDRRHGVQLKCVRVINANLQLQASLSFSSAHFAEFLNCFSNGFICRLSMNCRSVGFVVYYKIYQRGNRNKIQRNQIKIGFSRLFEYGFHNQSTETEIGENWRRAIETQNGRGAAGCRPHSTTVGDIR